jgi:hypothetical protein
LIIEKLLTWGRIKIRKAGYAILGTVEPEDQVT